MTEYLLMRLYGPMASWGEIAVGELRHTSNRPSRSALLGILASALGVVREDFERQDQIANSYRFGVRMLNNGSQLRDYHTIQYGVPGRKEVFRTRRQEMMCGRVETILSQREYRCDSFALVAVEALPNAFASLDELETHLKHPRFALYLGRKSCPLALPVMPQKVKAETLKEAFESKQAKAMLHLLDDLLDVGGAFSWEEGMRAGMTHDFDTVRHDQPIRVPGTRGVAPFAPRREFVAVTQN